MNTLNIIGISLLSLSFIAAIFYMEALMFALGISAIYCAILQINKKEEVVNNG